MNLPEAFIKRMEGRLGPEEFAEFRKALNEETPVSIRLNPLKTNASADLLKIDWSHLGYYLPQRPHFASDPAWHQGLYYVQEAGSMLIEQAFKSVRQSINGPLSVLDLCAAPGGKSTHLMSLLGTEDVLVSNEVIKTRVPVLEENLRKAGFVNSIVTHADSADFAQQQVLFDLILVDAPCSGEGLFRKDPESVNEWSPENVKTCELRQRRILDNITRCVRTGGFLIYSTCTYNPGENEDQVAYLLENGFEACSFDVMGKTHSQYACLPHRNRSEGFYISLFRKTGESQNHQRTEKSKFKALKSSEFPYQWLKRELPVYEYNSNCYFITDELKAFYEESGLSRIRTVSVGIHAAIAKDKLLIPSETLPFCAELDIHKSASIDLDQDEALHYLSKEVLRYSGQQKGYVFLSYKDLPLGLGKFAGNRINNLFPQEWRLRKKPEDFQKFSIHGFLKP